MEPQSQFESSDDDIIVLEPLSEEQRLQMENEQKQRLNKFYGNSSKYEMSYWYPKLRQFTFKSVCFPLTVQEAYLIQSIYYDQDPNQQTKKIQSELIQKVQKVIKELNNQKQSQNQGVFMKLSTRSPKDYCWDYREPDEARQCIDQLNDFLKINQITAQTPMVNLNTALYKFFLINSKSKLKIDSGQKFLKVFGRSDRIIIDICDLAYLDENIFTRLKEGKLTEEEKNKQFISVWARDWEDCDWSQEMRVFYHDYQVTAISQYDQYCYFPELQHKQQEIKTRIVAYFEEFKHILKDLSLSEGVMDIMVKEDSIKLIQINVFNENARASLFNWQSQRKILEEGPIEVRLLKQCKAINKAHLGSMMGMIDKGTLGIIEETLKAMDIYEKWKKEQ